MESFSDAPLASDSRLSRRALIRGLVLLPLAACVATEQDSGEDTVQEETAKQEPLPEEVLKRMVPDARHLKDSGVLWTYFGDDFSGNKAFAGQLKASMEAAGLLLTTQGNQTKVLGRQEDIRLLAQSALDKVRKPLELPTGNWSCSISEQTTCTAVYFKVEA